MRERRLLTQHTRPPIHCSYSYFPQYSVEQADDGINANKPDGQAREFYDGLNE